MVGGVYGSEDFGSCGKRRRYGDKEWEAGNAREKYVVQLLHLDSSVATF
jgi:hypothetical protein